jgi:hypothetical protein
VKSVFIIIVFSLICSCAYAATGSVQRSVVFREHRDTCLTAEDKLEKLRDELRYYRGMKATGAGITGVGAVFFVAGQSLLWTSVALNQTGKRSYSPTAKDPLFFSGLGATVLSAVPFAFGIPLLKYGTKKVKELKKQLPQTRHLQ